MRRLPALLTLLALVVLAAPATAGTTRTYKGKATGMDRDFEYGPAKVKVRGGKVRMIEMLNVKSSGCGDFFTVAFAPSDPKTQILKGSAKLEDGKLNVTYRPDRSIEDQKATIKATVTAKRVTGRFASGDRCSSEGRFTARR